MQRYRCLFRPTQRSSELVLSFHEREAHDHMIRTGELHFRLGHTDIRSGRIEFTRMSSLVIAVERKRDGANDGVWTSEY
jgi:hypothetical protein